MTRISAGDAESQGKGFRNQVMLIEKFQLYPELHVQAGPAPVNRRSGRNGNNIYYCTREAAIMLHKGVVKITMKNFTRFD